MNLNPIATTIGQLNISLNSLFGNDDSGMIHLSGLQMEELKNIDEKLNVIFQHNQLIYDELSKITNELRDLPDKTVLALFKSTLASKLKDVNADIMSYFKQQKPGVSISEEKKVLFAGYLKEIRERAGNVMEVGNFYMLPLVDTCLFFQLVCADLSDTPAIETKEALKRYEEWSVSCRKELEVIIGQEEKDWDANKSNLNVPELFAYSYCLTETTIMQYYVGGEITKTVDHHHINFRKYGYSIFEGGEQEPLISDLVKRGYLKANIVWTNLRVDEAKVQELAYVLKLDEAKASLSVTPVKTKIADGFEVLESEYDLAYARPCAEGENIIKEDDNAKAKAQNLVNTNVKSASLPLITYGSLQSVANHITELTTSIISGEAPSNSNVGNFEVQAMQKILVNARIEEWLTFIDANKTAVEQSEQRKKVNELVDKMAKLQTQSASVFEQYRELEKDLLDNLPPDLFSLIGQLGNQAGKDFERVVQNVSRETERFVQNLENNLSSGLHDIGEQLQKDGSNLTGLIEATEGFFENQLRAYKKLATETWIRIQEGKIVDAVWHTSIDQFENTDDNFATAVQKSALLNSIASSVAAAYLPYYGAALYAAWYMYKATGDLVMAVRTGAITYLTSQGMDFSKTVPGITKRILTSSLVGAAAIAASGGSEKEIIEGFSKGAVMNIANEMYSQVTKLDVEGKVPAIMEPYDKTKLAENLQFQLFDKDGIAILDKYGKNMVDITKLLREVTHVGIANSNELWGESSMTMQFFAEIPYVNDMAYFHDQWCAINQIDGITTQVTILPALMLTVAGSKQPTIDQIQEVILKHYKKE